MALTDPDAQTPDMQGAGMPAPPQAQSMGGLIDALRSRGTLPANLAQTMQPVGAQPNAGLAFGSGVLNALSGGNAAANPYLQQHQEQQNRQFWQQRELARMQSQEQARKAKQEEAAFKISSDLLKADSPEARATGAQGVMRYMKGLGMQVPEGLIKSLATRRMTDEQMNSVYRDIHLKMADQDILTKYPDLSPDVLQQAKSSKDNPLILKTLGLKSPEEQLKQTYDLRISAAKALGAEHPELSGDANRVGAIQMKHRELFGKDYMEGDPETQQRAYKSAVEEIQAREDARERMKQEAMLNRLLAGIQLRTGAQAQKSVPIQAKQKMLEPFSKAQSVVKGVEMLEQALKEMPEGALPAGEDVASQYWAKLQRTTKYRGNPAIVKFQQLWGPVSIGQIDRGMFDEKGVRAIQAFSKQLDAVDNMPPRKALELYLQTVKAEIGRSSGSRIEDLEALENTPPDVLERAKSIHLGITGKGTPAGGPLNPEKDPLGILR